MPFPLKADYDPKGPLCQLRLGDLNTIFGMLNGVQMQIVPGLAQPEIVPPQQDGSLWTFRIPSSAVLPDPPATGAYVLVSQNGVPAWVALEPFVCPEET